MKRRILLTCTGLLLAATEEDDADLKVLDHLGSHLPAIRSLARRSG